MRVFGLNISRVKNAVDTPKPESVGVSPVNKPVRSIRWRRVDYALENSELVFSAVNRIASTISAMPVHLYHDTTIDREKTAGKIVCEDPSPSMTSAHFFRTMEACRLTDGNAYALKKYDEYGTLESLFVLDPGRVKPKMDDASGELWYEICPEAGSTYLVHGYNIVHIPFLSANGTTGISPLKILAGTLGYAEEMEHFNREMLAEGAAAQIIIESPANLDVAMRQKAIEETQAILRATGGQILSLESGQTAKRLGMSPVDAKLFEVEKISRSRVAMVYGLPPHLFGDYSADVGVSSQEQRMIEYLQLTILPVITLYEQELNRKILTPDERNNNYRFRFAMDAMLRADAATRAEVNYKAVRSAWRTPDEIRAEEGRPALPNESGTKALVSKDLAPVEGIINFYAKNPGQIG